MRDYDHEHAPVANVEQLDVIQRLARRRNGRSDSHSARHLHQDVRGMLDARAHGVELGHFTFEVLQLGRQNAPSNKRENVGAKRFFGRDTARRSVRLREKAFVGKVRHDVADRSRTEAVVPRARDGARSNGLASLDVGLNDRL